MVVNFSKYSFIILLMLCVRSASFAQDVSQRHGIIYYEESNFNLVLRHRGVAFGYEKAKIRSIYKTTFYGGEIGYLRHPKELRQRQPAAAGSNRLFNSFIYGKRNSVIALRGMYGQRISKSSKAQYKGVSIGFAYSGGLTLALMKPYYINVLIDGEDNLIKYTEENSQYFLEQKSITRSGRYTKGLFQVKPIPGLNFRSSVHLEWGEYDDIVRGADIGFIMDVFIKPLPILVNDSNRSVFLNLYVNLQFGRRK